MKLDSQQSLLNIIEELECDSNVKNILFSQLKNNSFNSDDINSCGTNETELLDENVRLKTELEELKKRNKMVEMFYANVGHELRTPLHGIIGMVHLMEKTPMNTNQKEYTSVTKSSAENLLVIVNDLLSLSQTKVGKLVIRKEPFSIYEFLNKMESMLRVRAEQKGIQLSFQTSNDIPEFLSNDKTRLFQILLNVLNNAIKFTHQGYIKLETEVLNQNESEVELRFIIKDTGIGIKKEKLSLLFDSFSRVHEEDGKMIEGTGLGLNIVKKLLNLLDGKINVDSEYKKGTTFTIDIPFQICENEMVNNDKQKNIQNIPLEWKSKRFLMIEDNKANVLYSKEIFEDWGLNLCIAKTLGEATEMMQEKYDCILCDVKLPDGNGLNYIKDLRSDSSQINQNTPTIVLTASTNEDGVLQFDKEYVQAYLSKPFPPEDLLAELKLLLKINNPTEVYTPQNNPTHIGTSDAETSAYSSTDFIDSLTKRFKGRTTLMIEMVKIFLDQSPVMLKILEASKTEENSEEIRFESHKFKSTVNIIGLIELKNYASKAELYFSNNTEITDDEKILIQDFIQQLKRDERIARDALEKMTIASN